jgi:CDP-diacylglycerol---glycerol-3-phosphate 3-phosphatidyltransferase
MTTSTQQEPKTFTAFLRKIFGKILDSIAGFLNGLGVKPNLVTITGLIGNIGAGVLISLGYLTWGGLLALLSAPLDALDGTMARLRGEDGNYGAFIDSVTDRYSEIAIYGGLLVYFYQNGTWQDALLVFFAALGSVMVSYMRARAESLGYSAKIGLLTRIERYIVLLPGIIFHHPSISLWILAILTHFTALQRFFYVRRQTRQRSRMNQSDKENKL